MLLGDLDIGLDDLDIGLGDLDIGLADLDIGLDIGLAEWEACLADLDFGLAAWEACLAAWEAGLDFGLAATWLSYCKLTLTLVVLRAFADVWSSWCWGHLWIHCL